MTENLSSSQRLLNMTAGRTHERTDMIYFLISAAVVAAIGFALIASTDEGDNP